jgi:hypothetical protein
MLTFSARSTKLCSQKTPLIGKYIPQVMQSAIELLLLSSWRFDKHVFRDNEIIYRNFHACELAYIRNCGDCSKDSFVRERHTSFKTIGKSLVREFNSWIVNQIRYVTKQRLLSRRWRLFFMCYSYRNVQSVIIICSYDLWVSSKLIHLIQNPLLRVTLSPYRWQHDDVVDGDKTFMWNPSLIS